MSARGNGRSPVVAAGTRGRRPVGSGGSAGAVEAAVGPGEGEGADLAAELAQTRARLSAAQLCPHFLLNSLHAVGVLVRTGERDVAVDAISHLGRLLRHVLEAGREDRLPLRREVAFLRDYLRMEALRFRRPPGLEVALGPRAGETGVPPMLLQPLVENALVHGSPGGERPVRVRLRARRAGEGLRIVVEDDGRGLPEDWDPQADLGTGLRTVRDRVHGAGGDLRISSRPGGGARAIIRLPVAGAEDAAGGVEGGGDGA